LKVQGVQGSEFRVQSSRFRFSVQGSKFQLNVEREP
jgi:hypothetical protein